MELEIAIKFSLKHKKKNYPLLLNSLDKEKKLSSKGNTMRSCKSYLKFVRYEKIP